MIKVETADGMVFTGAGSRDIVRQMKNTQWTAPDTKGEYMTEVIERVSDMMGEMPPVDYKAYDAEAFVMFLESHGLIAISPYEATEDKNDESEKPSFPDPL